MKQYIKTFLLAGSLFGITMGLFIGVFSGVYNGIFVGTTMGFFFGLIMSLFVLIQTKKLKRLGLEQNMENVLFEGGANHFKGPEAVGGWLFLTPNDLYFKSHSINIQKHEIKIPIDQIEKAKPGFTFGFVPNSLIVILKNDSIEKFVVFERKNWVKEINNAILNLKKG
jgi:hypothetical protein